jgi:hypothetical protein
MNAVTRISLSAAASIHNVQGLAADICFGFADNSNSATWKPCTQDGSLIRNHKRSSAGRLIGPPVVGLNDFINLSFSLLYLTIYTKLQKRIAFTTRRIHEKQYYNWSLNSKTKEAIK